MKLKGYQAAKVKQIVERSLPLIVAGGNKKLRFKSPTGSGKTIMMAAALEQLFLSAQAKEQSISFIWAAPRKLHTQSKQKLQNFYDDSQTLNCRDFAQLSENKIAEGEILFLNWESINRLDKNTIIKENERDFYLSKVVENTLEEGRKIVLVIDESHHTAKSEISKQLIDVMSPALTIEVSATPTMADPDEMVTVTLDEVRAEGMIKKSVLLNEGFKNVLDKKSIHSELADGQNKFILEQAMAKREDLARTYRENGITVNPLVLIQLPDKKALEDEIIRKEVEDILKADFGISVKNEKLAVYLSDEKVNLENIAKNTNETEVLIFKQAIALGWDCPRAQILVLFREHKSVTFSLQTIGRILRMPEPAVGHYGIEKLNQAYVFTNLSDISIEDEMARGYLTIHTSTRIPSYKNIDLKSVYRLRQRERTRLSSDFIGIFLDIAENDEISKKIKLENQTVNRGLITDAIIENVDDKNLGSIEASFSVQVENDEDLQRIFDSYIQNNLSPFHPEERSIGRLKDAIYGFFAVSFSMEYSSDQTKILNIVLSKENSVLFSNLIDKAKEGYSTLVESREKELVVVSDWNVPESLNFSADEEAFDSKLSVMLPFYSGSKFKTELAFIKYLESAKNVDWWFKNGDRDATFFAIPYEENGEKKPFYVDFVIKMKNGKIGLLDTKRGQTVKTSAEKSDGLQKYIQENDGVFGGIVNNTKEDFTGRWMVYQGSSADLHSDDFSNWVELELG
jgi:type III restriction enzyme